MDSLTNKRNLSNIAPVEQDEAACSKRLKLSIDSNDQEDVPYSSLDKVKINKSLDITFGSDIYGRQICSIVTDFLGYSSREHVNTMCAAFTKKCNEIINENNKKHQTNTPAVIILQACYDGSAAMNNAKLIPELEQISKNYYVSLRFFSQLNESFGEAISQAAEGLSGRQVILLIIRAHANESALYLGSQNIYTAEDVNADHFAPLASNANIIIESCEAGRYLARKIASVQSRSVFACLEIFDNRLITPCCDNHGYGLVAFDSTPAQNIISRRFTNVNGEVTEEEPCCVIGEGYEKNKNKLLDNIVADATSGDAFAQYTLGIYYGKGVGFAQSDEESARWHLAAAEQGSADAQFSLGMCYANGTGVIQSFEESAKWLLDAAEQGDSRAQFFYGLACYSGDGVTQSYEEAANWYLEAAEQGHSDAQFCLGVCYSEGQGVTQSNEMAVMWYQEAASRGNEKAQNVLDTYYSQAEGVTRSDDENSI